MRKLLFVSLCGIAFLGAACEPEQYNPQSPSREARTQENCERATTEIIGTDRGSEFDYRVRKCMNG